MNDTQQPPAPGPSATGRDDQFDPRRLRSITDMKRSSDDRIVGGVCAGAARYLNVDPVIIRVVIAVLTVAGFAGLILYAAAWLLLPAEDADRSVAAEWFGLDKNEEQVRVVGLVVAVVLAALSVVGDSSWAWWGDAPWWILPFALVAYLVWIRPRRRREERQRRETAEASAGLAAGSIESQPLTSSTTAAVRERRSRALLGLTTSLAAIALAATLIYDETRENVPWTTYVAVALAVVGVGLLIGTLFGDGGALIGIGLLLMLTLGVGSVLPSGRIGAQQPTPSTSSEVEDHYRHGVGLLELDLTQVTDRQNLIGRTIELDAGVGQTKVIVPDGLPVSVEADLRAGEVSLLGIERNGTDVSLDTGASDPATSLRIDIDQKIGNIEVISR